MKRKFISFFSRRFLSTKKAVFIGDIKVPEVPDEINYTGKLEICHSFTLNLVKARQRKLGEDMPTTMNNDDKYQIFDNNPPLIDYLIACGYKKSNPKSLELYDIIVIYGGGTLLHSMVVLDNNKWIGTNNTNTFSKIFFNAGVPFEELSKLAWRSVIDFNDQSLSSAGLRYILSSTGRSQLQRGKNIEILFFDVYRKNLK